MVQPNQLSLLLTSCCPTRCALSVSVRKQQSAATQVASPDPCVR